jgi:hypothetical protein
MYKNIIDRKYDIPDQFSQLILMHIGLIKTKNADLLTRKYRLGKMSVNFKYSLVLTGMFTFKPASQLVECYHSVVSCALTTEELIQKNFCKFSK